LRQELFGSPEFFPLVLDVAGDRVGFVRLDERAYAEASFLDERLIAQGMATTWVPWAEIAPDAANLSVQIDFIFHIGHVGSTLLSRLLNLSDQVFSVREPAILRTLARLEPDLASADGPWDRPEYDARLGAFLGLWSRVFRPGQRTLLKATSFVGEMSPVLMSRSPGARAILMFVSPQVYLAAILGGPASRAEVPTVSAARLARLHRRLGGEFWRLEDLSEGQQAAMGWACEILGLAAAADQFGDRILWLEFEDFLAHPAAGLAAALNRLHDKAGPDDVAAMLRSPDFHRYSKAPEHAYDARRRHAVLSQALQEHRREIDRGLAWLNDAGAAHGALANAARLVARAPRLA
jgi:hypothetical protein